MRGWGCSLLWLAVGCGGGGGGADGDADTETQGASSSATEGDEAPGDDDDDDDDDDDTQADSSGGALDSTGVDELPPPVAVDDEIVFHEDLHNWSPGDPPNLFANDEPADGSLRPLESEVVSDNGAVISIDWEGTFTYDGEGFIGADGFQYAVESSTSAPEPSDPAAVSLTIEPTTHDIEDLRLAGATDILDVDLGDIEPRVIGDIDGDGWGEIAILDNPIRLGSRYLIVPGGPGPMPEFASIASGDVGWTIDNSFEVAPIGNFNGDAYDDFLVRGGDDAMVIFGGPELGHVDGQAVDPDFGVRVAPYEGSFGFTHITGLGDFNGDGLDDVALSSSLAAVDEDVDGAVFVLFGRAEPGVVPAASLAEGEGGFAISPSPEYAGFGNRVANAGDVDGDGLSDLLIYNVEVGLDTAWVVFGTEAPASFSIDELGDGGFRIDVGSDPFAGDIDARRMTGIGDFDGDGLGDFIMTDRYFETEGHESIGRLYFVRGKADTQPVALADVARGVGGWVIDGAFETAPGLGIAAYLGESIAALGDISGDGLADFAVSAPGARRLNPNQWGVGRVYVVHGRAGDEAPDLAALSRGEGGYVLVGARDDDDFGVGIGCAQRPGGCDIVLGVNASVFESQVEVVRTDRL